MLGLANEVLLAKLLVDRRRLRSGDRQHARRAAATLGWVEGIAAIDRKLDLLLTRRASRPIEAVGKPFDPHEHEAIVQEERTDVADGTVIAELQRGYRIRDRVLRPAMVAVARTRRATRARPSNINSTRNDRH